MGIVKRLADQDFVTTVVTEQIDTVPAWAKATKKPSYTASEVGADASGTAESLVNAHNTATDAHADIRDVLTNKANLNQVATYITPDL